MMRHTYSRGYTLIELIIAVSIFAVIMMLSAGAYFITISIDKQAQANSTAVTNLSFALETMARTIRSGNTYKCNNSSNDCSGGTSFSYNDASTGITTTYSRDVNGAIIATTGSTVAKLTDSQAVSISTLNFYLSGAATRADGNQPHVTIVVSGSVSTGQGTPVPFTVETGATMRALDI